MGAHQIVGAVVQQIMPEAAPLHRTAQRGDLCSVRAVGGDDIIGAALRVLRAQIPVEPVAVVPGIGAALAHQPDAPVCRNKGAAHCTQQLAQQHGQQFFQVAQRSQKLSFHQHYSFPLFLVCVRRQRLCPERQMFHIVNRQYKRDAGDTLNVLAPYHPGRPSRRSSGRRRSRPARRKNRYGITRLAAPQARTVPPAETPSLSYSTSPSTAQQKGW